MMHFPSDPHLFSSAQDILVERVRLAGPSIGSQQQSCLGGSLDDLLASLFDQIQSKRLSKDLLVAGVGRHRGGGQVHFFATFSAMIQTLEPTPQVGVHPHLLSHGDLRWTLPGDTDGFFVKYIRIPYHAQSLEDYIAHQESFVVPPETWARVARALAKVLLHFHACDVTGVSFSIHNVRLSRSGWVTVDWLPTGTRKKILENQEAVHEKRQSAFDVLVSDFAQRETSQSREKGNDIAALLRFLLHIGTKHQSVESFAVSPREDALDEQYIENSLIPECFKKLLVLLVSLPTLPSAVQLSDAFQRIADNQESRQKFTFATWVEKMRAKNIPNHFVDHVTKTPLSVRDFLRLDGQKMREMCPDMYSFLIKRVTQIQDELKNIIGYYPGGVSLLDSDSVSNFDRKRILREAEALAGDGDENSLIVLSKRLIESSYTEDHGAISNFEAQDTQNVAKESLKILQVLAEKGSLYASLALIQHNIGNIGLSDDLADKGGVKGLETQGFIYHSAMLGNFAALKALVSNSIGELLETNTRTNIKTLTAKKSKSERCACLTTILRWASNDPLILDGRAIGIFGGHLLRSTMKPANTNELQSNSGGTRFESVIRQIRQAAQENNEGAKYLACKIDHYGNDEKGLVIERYESYCRRVFDLAAEGNKRACYRAAVWYLRGVPDDQSCIQSQMDEKKAKEWIQLAAANGIMKAKLFEGVLYCEGIVVANTSDIESASKCMTLAISSGHLRDIPRSTLDQSVEEILLEAIYDLADQRFKAAMYRCYLVMATSKKLKSHVPNFQGNCLAALILRSVFCYAPRLIPRPRKNDVFDSLRSTAKSSSQSEREATFTLLTRWADSGAVLNTTRGWMCVTMLAYFLSWAEDKHKVAAPHYIRAAESQNIHAMNMIGFCLHNDFGPGPGPSTDKAEAFKWFSLGASHGHAWAVANMALCYENGDGTTRDYGKAYELYLKAANQGLPNAFVACARLLEEKKLEVGNSAELALKYYRQASIVGNQSAIGAIEKLTKST